MAPSGVEGTDEESDRHTGPHPATLSSPSASLSLRSPRRGPSRVAARGVAEPVGRRHDPRREAERQEVDKGCDRRTPTLVAGGRSRKAKEEGHERPPHAGDSYRRSHVFVLPPLVPTAERGLRPVSLGSLRSPHSPCLRRRVERVMSEHGEGNTRDTSRRN